jgi:hypothetical protein
VATYLAATPIIGGPPGAINMDGGLAGASGNTEVLDYSGWNEGNMLHAGTTAQNPDAPRSCGWPRTIFV